MNPYYIYIYFDPRKVGVYQYENYIFEYEPFYVGRGKITNRKIQRLHQHLYDAKKDLSEIRDKNTYKIYKIKNILESGLEPIILKYKDNLIREDANFLERDLILKIGRKNENGPLTNLSKGGDGGVGGWEIVNSRPQSEETKLKKSLTMKGVPKSEETKNKMREYNKNNKDRRSYIEKFGEELALQRKLHLSKINSGENNYFYGRNHTEETKKSIGKKNAEKIRTEEFKQLISESSKKLWNSEEYKEKIFKSRKEFFLKNCLKYKIKNIITSEIIIVNGKVGILNFFNVKGFNLNLYLNTNRLYKDTFLVFNVE